MKKATVVLTRFNEPNELVNKCLNSLKLQEDCKLEVLMLDQIQSKDIEMVCKNLNTKNINFIYKNIPAWSLSYARSLGLKESKTDIVILCDVDCTFKSNWAAEILNTFEKTQATIVGTKIVPRWQSKPHWYHKSKYILEFYSMLDIADRRISVTKIVGASFAANKKKLGQNSYFSEQLGRTKGKLLGGEETDLCDRVIKGGQKVIYTPFTYAEHWVAAERINLRWLMKRAYYGGYSKAKGGSKTQTFNKRPKLIDYFSVALIMPAYMLGRFKGKLA